MHLEDCGQFFERTRPDQIDDLCKDIYKKLHPQSGRLPDFSKDGEYASWYYSLPDLAQLLHDPETYRKKTIKEALELVEALDRKIKALEDFSSSKELKKFTASKAYAEMMSSPDTKAINKVLDPASSSALTSLEESLSILKKETLKKITEGLKKQRADLFDAKSELEEEELSHPLANAAVDIEYPLYEEGKKDPQRIDVLLSDPLRKRYAIIELKQWTEDSIVTSISENEDGDRECIVSIVPGKKSQPHPAVKVREFYKKKLAAEKGEDAIIRCFVYLHNQMYKDGQLFQVPKDPKLSIYDDCPWPNNILYTRLWHGSLLKRLTDLFDEAE